MALRQALSEDPEAVVRSRAAQSLGYLHDKESAPALRRADESYHVRVKAAEALYAPGRNAFYIYIYIYIYAPGSKGVPRARAGCADPGLRRPPQECPGPAQGVQIQAPREEGRESRSDPRRTSLRRAL